MKRAMQVLLTVSLVLFGSGPAWAQTTISTQPIQDHERAALFPSAKMIEIGRTVAGAACAECHGMDGRSVGEGQPYLAGQRAIYLYRVLQAYQNNNRKNESMQHVSGFLNDEALLSVSAYFANQTPAHKTGAPESANEPERLEENPFTGIRSALNKCTKCHGETGNSSASGMPNLTAQGPEYFASSVQSYADGSRNHKLMSKLTSSLDEQTIKEMGIFYAVQQPQRSETSVDGDAEAGSKLSEKCTNCHGADGNANSADMPTLAGQDARYFIKAMQAYQDGKRKHEKMSEAASGISETEIKNLAAFYASQEPVRRDIRTPFTTAEWVQRCERCHGINGNSTDPRFPMLAGQDEKYLRKAMQAYASGARSTSVMHAMSAPLSESDIERIVRHYSSQEAKSVVYIQLPCEDVGTD